MEIKTRFAFVEESKTAPRGMLLLLMEDVPLGDDLKVRWCSDEEDRNFKNAISAYAFGEP